MTTKLAHKPNPHIGSDFDDFLGEEGLYDEAQAVAVKRVLAHELETSMAKAQKPKPNRGV